MSLRLFLAVPCPGNVVAVKVICCVRTVYVWPFQIIVMVCVFDFVAEGSALHICTGASWNVPSLAVVWEVVEIRVGPISMSVVVLSDHTTFSCGTIVALFMGCG